MGTTAGTMCIFYSYHKYGRGTEDGRSKYSKQMDYKKKSSCFPMDLKEGQFPGLKILQLYPPESSRCDSTIAKTMTAIAKITTMMAAIPSSRFCLFLKWSDQIPGSSACCLSHNPKRKNLYWQHMDIQQLSEYSSNWCIHVCVFQYAIIPHGVSSWTKCQVPSFHKQEFSTAKCCKLQATNYPRICNKIIIRNKLWGFCHLWAWSFSISIPSSTCKVEGLFVAILQSPVSQPPSEWLHLLEECVTAIKPSTPLDPSLSCS